MSDEIKERTVYMLCRTDGGNDAYVGSTSLPLERRLHQHRYRAKNFMELGYSGNNKLYTRLNEVGLNKWRIIPLLSFSCTQKTIFEFERVWVTATGATLNMASPIREEETVKEYQANYCENNKDAIKEYKAKYRENNKDAIKEYNANYRENNKDAIKEYKATYRENNKNAIKEYDAKYGENNKDFKRYYCELCDVACESKKDLTGHFDTLKHSYAWLNSVD